ncbi:MAG: hypothetical protein MSA65_03415 [Mollicutes bacterium]|nr:hypothetical protein [Mollicutes bacterium]
MALTEKSRVIYDYVKEHDGQQFTAQDIADATGVPVKSVNGVVTMSFQKKGLMERIPAEIEVEDGKHKSVKFIQLTDKGRNFDPDAE